MRLRRGAMSTTDAGTLLHVERNSARSLSGVRLSSAAEKPSQRWRGYHLRAVPTRGRLLGPAPATVDGARSTAETGAPAAVWNPDGERGLISPVVPCNEWTANGDALRANPPSRYWLPLCFQAQLHVRYPACGADRDPAAVRCRPMVPHRREDPHPGRRSSLADGPWAPPGFGLPPQPEPQPGGLSLLGGTPAPVPPPCPEARPYSY